MNKKPTLLRQIWNKIKEIFFEREMNRIIIDQSIEKIGLTPKEKIIKTIDNLIR